MADDELFADVQGDLPSDEALGGIAEAARMRASLAQELAKAEDDVAYLKGEIRRYDEVVIPDLMSTVGMANFTLDDGTIIKVEPFVDVAVREDDRPAAWDWLADNGFGDLVKHEVSVTFGKGDQEAANAAIEALEAQGLPVRDRLSVHPGTLRAFVKEQLRAAADQGVPPVAFPDEFKIYQGRRAKLSQTR